MPPISTGMSVPAPPGNGDAVDLADEVDCRGGRPSAAPRSSVTCSTRAAGWRSRPAPCRSPRRPGVGLQPGQLDGGEVGHRDFGQQLELDRELEILLVLELGDHVDLRLQSPARRPRSVRTCWVASLTTLFQHLGHHRGAEALADDGHRHLAGAEAGQVDGLAEFGQPLGRACPRCRTPGTMTVKPRFSPSESVSVTCIDPSLRPSWPWCGRRDLNPHGLRHQNLNLACLPISPRPRV